MKTVEIPASQTSQPNLASEEKITLTPAALQRVEEWILKQGTGVGLRLGVKKAGCSGMTYVVTLAENNDIGDDKESRIFEIGKGLQLIVDGRSFPYLKGVTIDYVRESLNRSSFKFINPNEKSSCGCGESFYT